MHSESTGTAAERNSIRFPCSVTSCPLLAERGVLESGGMHRRGLLPSLTVVSATAASHCPERVAFLGTGVSCKSLTKNINKRGGGSLSQGSMCLILPGHPPGGSLPALGRQLQHSLAFLLHKAFLTCIFSAVIEACPDHHSHEGCSLQQHLKPLRIFCFAPSCSYYPFQSKALQLQSFVISH